MLVKLQDIFNSALVSVHFPHYLFFNIDQTYLSIRLPKNDDFRIFLPMLPESGHSIGRKVQSVCFLRIHGDSGPNTKTSAPCSSKNIITIPNQFIDILERLINNLRIDHQGLSFRVNYLQDTLLVISMLFRVNLLKLADIRLVAKFIYHLGKGAVRAKLVLIVVISTNEKPVQNAFILFFMVVYFFLQLVEISVESEEELLGVEKVDGLFNMFVCRPVAALELLHKHNVLFLGIQMPLSLVIVGLPVFQHLLFVTVHGICDRFLQLLHQNLEVYSLLLDLVFDVQSFFFKLFHQSLFIHGQFQCFDISLGVIIQMDEFLLHLFLHFQYILFPIFGVEVEFVVMFGDAELAGYPF